MAKETVHSTEPAGTPATSTGAPSAAAHIDRLIATRQRTFAAIDGVSDRDLERVHTRLLSPVIWDLAHIAAFADLWLADALGRPLIREDLAITYDAGATPRAGRGALELLDHAGARDYMARVDDALYSALPTLDLSADSSDPLLRNGYLVGLLVEHEEQHRETILQALHFGEPGVLPVGPPAAWAPAPSTGPLMVDVPSAHVELGARSGFTYDNERPTYIAAVPAFKIDRTPVTVGAYREFIADGGYHDRRHWSDEGWAWRQEEQAERPLFWQADGTIRRFDRFETPSDDQPVMNVSYWEAEAFAAWRGVRLPTEIEWEAAARHDATTGISRRQPWGAEPTDRPRANVDGAALGPLPPSPTGAAPCGALGMIGDVWEWTSSPLSGYPGFRAYPYPEYSEVFFGGPYRVLRGGSWATAGGVARSTFRNWDHPERRQIFSGFRCAADLDPSTAAETRPAVVTQSRPMPTTHAEDCAVLEDHGLELDEGTPETWTALAADVLRGLTADAKHLPPKWFYDARGSDLFDQICELPEYYPTRAEAALLAAEGDAIAKAFPARELVELGSGSSTKTPLLLGPLLRAGALERYVPVDVSASAIALAQRNLAQQFPDLDVRRRILDFTTQLHLLGRAPQGGRLVAFLGSTIGNLEPVEVQTFLEALHGQLGPDDAVLVGTDLVKDVATLEAAYNDSAGITAEFNKNVLHVINRELDADFDVDAFAHQSVWNAELERIETHLRATAPQQVRVRSLSLDVSFDEGETIFTEISRKFRRETVAALYAAAGFELTDWFEDDGVYGLSIARPV